MCRTGSRNLEVDLSSHLWLTELVSCMTKQTQINGDTFQNPADIGIRGASPDEFERSELWWNGPKFSGLSEVEWPEPKFPVVECEESLEMKGTK